ncbi:hypothetical protein [Xanthomonas vesicatoria]|uniref:Uncharacterized protein n=1 Tax=Xanthomonas vesicatoria TaxID=56460 RepID=A0ABS8L591_9XANT|nr:hypothetical protein [Xanthomonas vesicatoria]MCC8620422.1 hypothetical protein [Xanthomonas vesicatoria]MDG4491563.1 hypothetical protein [Xanthomonas vesicatoria]
MTGKQVSPLTLTQVPRWRITRLLEMVQRDYRADEVEAELNGWLATGIDRVPSSFNLQAAAARAVHAVNPNGDSLMTMFSTDLSGRLTTKCRDVVETALYAALAPHLDQMFPDVQELRTYQCSFGFSESSPNPTYETP